MILRQSEAEKLSLSILHVCGDDPNRAIYAEVFDEYSPRMWR